MSKYKDITNNRYGKLVAIASTDKFTKTSRYWICRCDCGKTEEFLAIYLKRGSRTSCGCDSSRVIDLTNKKFGRLYVLEKAHRSLKGNLYYNWRCLCDCGKIVLVEGDCLRGGSTRSCGCLRIKDLVGKKFNRWSVISHSEYRGNKKPGRQYYVCRCDCGKIGTVSAANLSGGQSKSCGCLQKEWVGPNSPYWNPNLTMEDRLSHEYGRGRKFHSWADKIRVKYKLTCQKCGIINKDLTSHHILPWSTYPKLRYRISNGICFCRSCHKKYHKQFGQNKNVNRETLNEFLKNQ